MSRKRSRNVMCKWPKNFQNEEKLFGPRVLPSIPHNDFFPSNDIIQRHKFNIRNEEYFEDSSSSSLSAYEQLEAKLTRQVEKELIKLDKILQKEVPIPKEYDRDEIELWMNTFPTVSIWNSKNFQKKKILKIEKASSKPLIKNIEKKRSSGIEINTPYRYNSELKKVRALSRSEILSSRWLKKNNDDGDHLLPKILSASIITSRKSGKINNNNNSSNLERINEKRPLILPPINVICKEETRTRSKSGAKSIKKLSLINDRSKNLLNKTWKTNADWM